MIQCSDFRGVLFETKQKCKDGTILNIEINSNLMAYSGKKLVFCVCRDITEKKRYADELLKAKITAEEASLTKNEFLATMSHELRTPLNSIIGFSEILKGEDFGKINEAQAEYIDYISKSGKHLLNVINDILDLSKIEAGRMELNYEQFYLLDSINEVKMSLTPLAIKKRVDLDLELTSLPETIIADRTKLQEIIYNLASNAIKFTPEKGKVTIKASTDDRLISISIQDTGIGISTADMDKLFQPFKQIKPYMNHELEGTGLGLAITKKFIEMHGGRISVQSKPGDGSSFTFTIPKEPEYENINVDA
jgi:signal transduction histidine kinase